MGQNDTKNERKDKEKTRRVETGKFFYDLSKSTFSITVLGSIANIIKTNEVQSFAIWSAATGLFAATFFFINGYKILNK